MQAETRQSRGAWIGLAVSAALHLLLFWWAVTRPEVPRPQAAREDAAVELTVVEIELDGAASRPPGGSALPDVESDPLPPEPRPPSAQRPAVRPKAPTAPVAAQEPIAAPAPVAAPEPTEVPTPGPGAPTAGASDASPGTTTNPIGPGRGAPLRGPPAAPGERPWYVPGGGGTYSPGRASAGSTTRPGDDGGAAARERLAEGPRVKERVDGILAEAGGAYRVATGTMDPYFGELGRALNAELEHIPEALDRPDVLKELYTDFAQKMGRVGRTGAAWEDTPIGEGRDRDTMPLAGLSRESDRNGGGGAGPGGRPVLLGASGQRGGLPALLTAEVAIHQAPDGSITELKLLKSSGNPVFDTFVLEAAPAGVKRLAPPPERGSGIHAHGMRTAWRFTGHLKLDKRLRDFKLPEDLPYLGGLLLAGQFGGSIDFTNLKDTPVADLRDPRWDLRAKLLRVE